MEYLSALGIGLFASWLPAIALWLVIAFAPLEILVYVMNKYSPEFREKHNKLTDRIGVYWLGFWLFGAPIILFWFLFAPK